MLSSLLYRFIVFLCTISFFICVFTVRGTKPLNSFNRLLNKTNLLYFVTKEKPQYILTLLYSPKLYFLSYIRFGSTVISGFSFLIVTSSSFSSGLKILFNTLCCFSAALVCAFNSLPN